LKFKRDWEDATEKCRTSVIDQGHDRIAPCSESEQDDVLAVQQARRGVLDKSLPVTLDNGSWSGTHER